MAATTCPITRDAFRQGAKPLEVMVNGDKLLAEVREFSTGSLGWFLTGKVLVNVGGVPTKVQVGLNLTVIGSKELPQ